ncbi:hypothetical protein FSARC_8691 [Fusarium sarcochroum]|uniref:Uncharacterized protein n=1 Tax=Fusarium sarcochroum TaxID=1208366 RepID=A0A8H4X6X1_9HYPO|nr:hypothetical protein FSARC_8691 [Fusarium sarcochroum]
MSAQLTKITMADIALDRAITDQRTPEARIDVHSKLSLKEKQALIDLINSYIEVRETQLKENTSITTDVLNQFYGMVFACWDSSVQSNDAPNLPAIDVRNTCVQVGSIKVDQYQLPAFLGLSLDPSESLVIWRPMDRNFSYIPLDSIEFDEGLSMTQALSYAIDRYDARETLRVVTFNMAQITLAARRRIAKWAKKGTSDNPSVDLEDSTPLIEPLVLARDFYDETNRRSLWWSQCQILVVIRGPNFPPQSVSNSITTWAASWSGT